MITLQTCSQDPDYRTNIGKFSSNISLLIEQYTKEEDKEERKKLVISPKNMKAKSEDASIVEELEDEDLEVKELGLVKGVQNSFKWIKKVIKANMLSLTLHLSVLLFLRELSKKKLFSK
jgi:hypothetical protein